MVKVLAREELESTGKSLTFCGTGKTAFTSTGKKKTRTYVDTKNTKKRSLFARETRQPRVIKLLYEHFDKLREILTRKILTIKFKHGFQCPKHPAFIH